MSMRQKAQDFLRATEGEGGNQNASLAFQHPIDGLEQALDFGFRA